MLIAEDIFLLLFFYIKISHIKCREQTKERIKMFDFIINQYRRTKLYKKLKLLKKMKQECGLPAFSRLEINDTTIIVHVPEVISSNKYVEVGATSANYINYQFFDKSEFDIPYGYDLHDLCLISSKLTWRGQDKCIRALYKQYKSWGLC